MFEFGYLSEPSSVYKTFNAAYFITGKGIKLGMLYRQVARINGNAFDTIKKNNVTILKYKLTRENLPFLQYYNMPEYYAEYYFIKNKLFKVKFGFPNL